jgi:hypothetical protein
LKPQFLPYNGSSHTKVACYAGSLFFKNYLGLFRKRPRYYYSLYLNRRNDLDIHMLLSTLASALSIITSAFFKKGRGNILASVFTAISPATFLLQYPLQNPYTTKATNTNDTPQHWQTKKQQTETHCLSLPRRDVNRRQFRSSPAHLYANTCACSSRFYCDDSPSTMSTE